MLGQGSTLIGKKLNLFPLVFVSWVMVIYLLATGNLSWYTWVFIGIVVLERLWLQVSIWLQGIMIKEVQRRLMAELMKGADQPNPGGFGGLALPPDPGPSDPVE